MILNRTRDDVLRLAPREPQQRPSEEVRLCQRRLPRSPLSSHRLPLPRRHRLALLPESTARRLRRRWELSRKWSSRSGRLWAPSVHFFLPSAASRASASTETSTAASRSLRKDIQRLRPLLLSLILFTPLNCTTIAASLLRQWPFLCFIVFLSYPPHYP